MGCSTVIAQPSRFSEWMVLATSRRAKDVFVGGVLCTRVAWVIWIRSVVAWVRAGAEVRASPRLADVVIPKHAKVKNGITKT
jgi:hypothetical protein